MCHSPNGDGTFGAGSRKIDPNNLKRTTLDGLAKYIEDTMPKGDVGSCKDSCAEDIAAYLKTFVSSGSNDGLCSDSDYVCVDFESGNPENMDLGSTATVVNGNAKNGNGSLRFVTNNRGDGSAAWYGGFMKTNFSVPGTHWGRMYYKIDKFDNPASYTHVTFMAATAPQTDVRLVDIVRGPQGTHQYLYNFPDDQGGKASSYNWTVDNQWVCVEWHVDKASQTYEFYRDGTKVNEISGNVANDHGGIPDNYSKLFFGGQVYQNGPNISGWIDDIVVGPERNPCP